MEGKLADKFNGLFKLLADSMEKLATNLHQVSKIVKDTKAITSAQQSEIINLHNNDEKLSKQLAILNNRFRFFNLKLRGIPESAEGTTDLVAYISSWLATTLSLEENIAPNLSQAYRLRSPNNPARVYPRDIIITFIDICGKNKILEYAKKNGYITIPTRLTFTQILPRKLWRRNLEK